jgi:hypothetical protein
MGRLDDSNDKRKNPGRRGRKREEQEGRTMRCRASAAMPGPQRLWKNGILIVTMQ